MDIIQDSEKSQRYDVQRNMEMVSVLQMKQIYLLLLIEYLRFKEKTI